MDVKRNGTACGSASLETRGLYVRVRVEYAGPENAVLRAYLRGDRGTVRLGVPAPEKGRYLLVRDMTAREIAEAGAPIEVLLFADGESGEGDGRADGAWTPLERPELFFGRGEAELAGRRDCLWRREGGGRGIAIPYSPDSPFPLVRYFCFARIAAIGGRYYAAYSFDGSGTPTAD
jgi:hypothetical protein